jgi:U6 snRNA-associated Sm-like protein LSm3
MGEDSALRLEEPLDLIRLSLEEVVSLKCRGDRELRGYLHAYDQHLNMMLGDVTEKCTTYVKNEATGEEEPKEITRQLEMLFVRGDSIIIISPPSKKKADA